MLGWHSDCNASRSQPDVQKNSRALVFCKVTHFIFRGGGGAALFSHLIDNLGCRKSLQLVITRC